MCFANAVIQALNHCEAFGDTLRDVPEQLPFIMGGTHKHNKERNEMQRNLVAATRATLWYII
jgi:hypothetical protein